MKYLPGTDGRESLGPSRRFGQCVSPCTSPLVRVRFAFLSHIVGRGLAKVESPHRDLCDLLWRKGDSRRVKSIHLSSSCEHLFFPNKEAENVLCKVKGNAILQGSRVSLISHDSYWLKSSGFLHIIRFKNQTGNEQFHGSKVQFFFWPLDVSCNLFNHTLVVTLFVSLEVAHAHTQLLSSLNRILHLMVGETWRWCIQNVISTKKSKHEKNINKYDRH